MGVHGCILYDNIFGNPNTERSKVPYTFNTSGYDLVGYFLSFVYWYCDYTDCGSQLLPHGRKTVNVIDRNTVDDLSIQFRTDIKTGNNI